MRGIVIAAIAVALSGCTSKTEFGPCIGVNGERDPKLVYHYSGWNIAMGVIFWEILAPPIVVVLDDLECPVARR